jgi:hypothetical protein
MAEVGGRQVGNNDLGVMAAGAAALVFSFLPYVGVSFKITGVGSTSASINAWHGIAFLGVLLLVAAAGVVAARVFGGVTLPTLPVGWHVVLTALAGIGTLILIVRGLTYGGDTAVLGSSVSAGMRWGGYLLSLAGIAETVFAVMGLRESGESLSFDRGTQGDVPPPATT